MPDLATVSVVLGTFLVAGTVKGVVGLGLPTVSLALLAVALDLHTAMALLLVPSFVTNLWQSAVGGRAGAIVRRLWPFLLPATLMVWAGVTALTRTDTYLLTALLGVLLVAYSAVSLAAVRITVPYRHQAWAGPLIGAANGLLTGLTGSFVVPGVMYLQAIGLSRDTLVQAMGILFTLSTVALAAALSRADFLSREQSILSLSALAPALLGMLLGQKIRNRLSERLFRTVFFMSLLLLGTYLAVSSLQPRP